MLIHYQLCFSVSYNPLIRSGVCSWGSSCLRTGWPISCSHHWSKHKHIRQTVCLCGAVVIRMMLTTQSRVSVCVCVCVCVAVCLHLSEEHTCLATRGSCGWAADLFLPHACHVFFFFFFLRLPNSRGFILSVRISCTLPGTSDTLCTCPTWKDEWF